MQRRGTLVAASILAVLFSLGGNKSAFAGEPVVGMELSAAIPVGKLKRSADVGGAGGVYGGYHFSLSDNIGLALLANPEVSIFPADPPNLQQQGIKSDASPLILMAANAGPRLTIGDEQAQLFIDGRGGYFWELGGPLNDDGPGFNVGGGAAFGIAEGTYLTLVSRYNEVFMRSQRGYVAKQKGGSTDNNLRFVTAGIGIEHRFLAPEPVKAAPPPPPPPPPPPAAPMKKKIILRGVNFDFDKSNIRADARPVLDEAIDTLKEAGDVRVAVEGHTDSVGTDAYNQGLSVRRANSVADYLASGGISRSRMEVDGFGESRPVASNDTDDGRAQNRRVELKVVSE